MIRNLLISGVLAAAVNALAIPANADQSCPSTALKSVKGRDLKRGLCARGDRQPS
jgi:hypothetical protein